LIALSTNDALSASAPSIAALMSRKNIYFVPFYQDDAQGKPSSLVADFNKLTSAIRASVAGQQLQPIICG
ncbi:MAG: dipicolinate synthase subunit B, partial [Oscillospiraceae bacterium]|nr:dipicolinate synthase subunit B [Oscillospiraceae bacterium]